MASALTGHPFTLGGARLTARPSGALVWLAERLLVVSDLHLGKSARIARGGGTLLPPYEGRDTLDRLDSEIAACDPRTVICLGDSFDDLRPSGLAQSDLAQSDLAEPEALWLARLMAGRRWIWIAGNHDPGPVSLGGEHLIEMRVGPLSFRHIARPDARAEVSGHFHPKARIAGQSRPCFLIDPDRAILPAFGTYTGGLSCTAPPLALLMRPDALAVLTGPRCLAVPMPR